MGSRAEIPLLGSIFVDYENLVLTLTNEFQVARAEAEDRILGVLGEVEQNLAGKGVRVVRREAFADWSDYPTTSNELYRMGYRARNVGATIHKNSADIELSLSVQEVMLRNETVNLLVIAAGDRDYMPIAMRAIESAKDLLFVSFKESLSGDLKELVGPDGYLYIAPSSGQLISPKDESKRLKPVDRSARRSAPLKALTREEEMALRAAIESYDEYKLKYGDVKLSGFLVVGLAKALPFLSHLQRKQVFSSLEKKEVVGTSAKKDFFGETFTVFDVNDGNPLVKDARKRMGEKARRTS